ncbi:hypothetical protein A3H53_00145 [Candidatus Nomurabacteria bacterium RIFCSPLOWO2_02_FULL_40_10]|uniref:Uncharacterized protein n=2 Tax=Candidatus Nomuraibacteriota TaxID=1752729 RepID=A0A1F6Y085_9BACT|nr:MAG: hypothetical protein A2642_01175 [Candidatus Nomurabacteria bacterium RIFCSPHIGHO2_01_FULL_39_10]OGI99668.1 MAG: hypothetical protein A3H53_00145 [Candidatus Nomurabacteria bacterium RIFCSPLOWO2_02_FULL_40_10]
MKAISSKFNMYVRSVSVVNNNIEKLAFNIIIGSFGALALLYVLFLGNMVMNIVERRSFEADARVLSSEVGDLEFAYLSMSNNVDLALSYSLGFKEIKANFATRKALSFLPTVSSSVKIVQNDL